MNKRLYMVFDQVSLTTVGGIILENHDAPAIRAFHDALKMKDSLLAQHPADYSLLQLGEIDSEGRITTAYGGNPIVVATGAAWLDSNTQPQS